MLFYPDINRAFISLGDSHRIGGILEVDKKTVGQYTGLTDKSGKKIFEGDIVEINNRRYTVSFEKGCWVILGKVEFWDFLQTNVKSCKVIGNIYDNPELLEVRGND